MASRTYATPQAFKFALEERIRQAARAGSKDMNRVRQVLIYQRFLERVGQVLGDAVTLKGGVVLELRLERARATRDVDLRVQGSPEGLEDALKTAAGLPLADHLTFTIVPDKDHPTIENPGMRYDGRRYRVEAQLAGRLYGMPFGVDAAFADAMSEEPELIEPKNMLEFAGIPPTTLRVYPRVTHVAEKLHAYTMPRPMPNTRVKDLPDLGLLALTGGYEGGALRRAIDATFSFRGTHQVPAVLPVPPGQWAATYERMATENGLPWRDLGEAHAFAAAFLAEPLAGGTGTWSPDQAVWR